VGSTKEVAVKFEITYVSPGRPKRIVDEDHFARSSAFAPVLKLEVGQSAPAGRYRSANYKRIKRIA
jgi:hypothetical protein